MKNHHLCLTLCILSLFATQAYCQSGTTGPLVWTISDNTLIINGTGVMPDYTSKSSPWYQYQNKFKNVVIENGVSNLGNYAFEWCTNLTSIAFPSSMEKIGDLALFSTSLTSVEIPNSVTIMGDYAFYNCTSLISTNIPNSVKTLGKGVFGLCRALISPITIPNSVTIINPELFMETSISSITIPNTVTSIGNYAFYNCINLKSVTIPASVKSIGESAFSFCSDIKSVNLSNSVTYIGDMAFFGCVSITSLTIPNSISNIGYCTFGYCSSLTDLNIPVSVRSIDEEAFRSCCSLTSITIPNSVTSIGNYAFVGCSALTKVEVNWTLPLKITSIIFGSIISSVTLTVPVGTKVLYNTTDVWRTFGTILEKGNTAINRVSALDNAFVITNRLYLETPVNEVITIYSTTGQLLLTNSKVAGKATIELPENCGKMLIVKGGSGWVSKVMH